MRLNLIDIFIVVSAFMCIKSPAEDMLISQTIQEDGVWERPIVTSVIRAAKVYPDAVFVDLGANLGMFRFLFYPTPVYCIVNFLVCRVISGWLMVPKADVVSKIYQDSEAGCLFEVQGFWQH